MGTGLGWRADAGQSKLVALVRDRGIAQWRVLDELSVWGGGQAERGVCGG